MMELSLNPYTFTSTTEFWQFQFCVKQWKITAIIEDQLH